MINRINHYIGNPFILYAVVWCVVWALYGLKWTYLYPDLSIELTSFLFVTSVISLVIGIITYKAHTFEYNSINVDGERLSNIKKGIKVLYFMFLLEVLYCRQIPLVSILMGGGAEAYQNFNPPILHVFVVTGFLFYIAFVSHCLFCTKDKGVKKMLVKLMLLCFLYAVLIVNRAIIMYSFSIISLIYLMSRTNPLKLIGKMTFYAFLVFYLFGVLGNYRNANDMEVGREYIKQIGQATPRFTDSFVPTEFLWPYLYVTSPLSNVQNTMDKLGEIEPDVMDFLNYMIGGLAPQVISKRLGFMEKHGVLIEPHLNVGSIYYGSYAGLGWLGMWLSFLFMFYFVFVNNRLVPKGSIYYVTMLALVDTVIIFNMFDNMFKFSGLVPALCYPILLSYIEEYKLKRKQKNTNNEIV